jgi:hypothetical protein
MTGVAWNADSESALSANVHFFLWQIMSPLIEPYAFRNRNRAFSMRAWKVADK